jgi:hypothetical protein
MENMFFLQTKLKPKKYSEKIIYPELKKADASNLQRIGLPSLGYVERTEAQPCFLCRKQRKAKAIDIMPNEPYDSPQKPFGGDEDYIWSPDGKSIIYVSKKKFGTDYALSTNTDLYEYNIETKTDDQFNRKQQRLRHEPSFFANRKLNLVANETRRI